MSLVYIRIDIIIFLIYTIPLMHTIKEELQNATLDVLLDEHVQLFINGIINRRVYNYTSVCSTNLVSAFCQSLFED